MGFYNEQTRSRKSRRRWHQGGIRWTVMAVCSAAIGSGLTLLAGPAVEGHRMPLSASMAVKPDPNVMPSFSSAISLNVNDGIVKAVKKVTPAVFGVINYATVSDFFTQETKLQAAGVGTGVLFYKDNRYGYVVTNNHVVEGATKVQLVMSAGKHIHATVMGTDPYTDLAVLRISAGDIRGIEPAQFANSDAIQVGEPAIAIGTPMGLDFADTVTAGIVSAKNRIMPVQDPQNDNMVLDYQAVIQTDAAINPGNSGGPLLNIKGQVIGINSSKIAAANVEGMGFSIPANEVRNIAQQIMQTGHAVHPALGISGWSLATLPEQLWPDVPIDYGVYVQRVTSAGARAGGLKPEDVIVGLNDQTVKTMADLRTYLFQRKPGETVTLRLYRGSRQLTLRVKLDKMETVNDAGTSASPRQQRTDDPLDPFAAPNMFGD
ncbi:trypsin-like peptidase domain-containing protein [Alicyclobacillus cycloheptanicus]|uniref:Serine protease Do n=1 Tax=Alicyclobacillus cycloheptanicus TaxID=1457 RepID=A0ABT9XKV6_9BACL|nr:trypsin-like peptidase domain-containing protein [Alicyclobacillus cycloheptanicus]MDQ0190920.1 serine protease Do [Alicyclobacillus cycloheptanicus]WDM02372.1 trypsin-like peptidase domain-containing protein [Alicyclobacillus cycloheptanicus]